MNAVLFKKAYKIISIFLLLSQIWCCSLVYVYSLFDEEVEKIEIEVSEDSETEKEIEAQDKEIQNLAFGNLVENLGKKASTFPVFSTFLDNNNDLAVTTPPPK